MKTILIVGGSGFIGSNLSEYFCEREFKVINFSRSPSLVRHKNLIDVCGDCKNTTILNEIFTNYKIDMVLHSLTSFTAMDELGSSQDVLATNLSAFIDLISVMKMHAVKKLIYISSGGSIYGVADAPIKETHDISPVSFYGWMKESCEHYLEFASRLDPEFKFLILRPANVYGKYQKIERIIGVALRNAIIGKSMDIYGNITTCKDYIHIDDFCEIVEKLMQSQNWNEVYNVGSGVGTSIEDILRYAQIIAKNKIEINYHERKSGDVPYNILDIGKLKKTINKSTFISVESGMLDMYKYVLSLINRDSD
jgi:UDP-glucose 4-epimerase